LGDQVWAPALICLRTDERQLGAARAREKKKTPRVRRNPEMLTAGDGAPRRVRRGRLRPAAALDGPGKDLKAAANDKAKIATSAKAIADAASKCTPGSGRSSPARQHAVLLTRIVGVRRRGEGRRDARAEQRRSRSRLLSSYPQRKARFAARMKCKDDRRESPRLPRPVDVSSPTTSRRA